MDKRIAILAGDGIGPEIMEEAKNILEVVGKKYQHDFVLNDALVGGAAFEKYEAHLPKETLNVCETSDAILFGAVGGPVDVRDDPQWAHAEKNVVTGLRDAFNFSTNITPVTIYPTLRMNSLLKSESVADVDSILVVRELSVDLASVVRLSFELAMRRQKKLTCVDKDTPWRETIMDISKEYPDVHIEFLLVNNAVFQLLKSPLSFDTILTQNMFGDILSYLSAALPGSIGLVPSASFNTDYFGIYEPVGGSAPDIAGKNIANPIAMILSCALMLRYSFDLEKEAQAIEKSVGMVLEQGYRTADIYQDGMQRVTTGEMGDAIVEGLK